MPSPQSTEQATTAVLTAPDVVKKEDVHKFRRRFIGPMPASALQPSGRPRKQKKRHRFFRSREDHESSSSNSDDSDSSSLSDVIHRHALEFFLKHGGQREDWGDSAQKSVRTEMRKRWRESDWGRIHKQQRQGVAGPKWMGSSFDVGVFLGVDVLDEAVPGLPPSEPSDAGLSTPPHPPATLTATPSQEAETFVTARSHPATTEPPLLSVDVSREGETVNVYSASSSTALLVESQSQASLPAGPSNGGAGPSTELPVSSSEPQANESAPTPDTHPDVPVKGGKNKKPGARVHYEIPVPPREVLARTGSAVKTTSAGAAEQASSENTAKWGDVIIRDRMLVRVSYTEDGVPPTFDERRNQTTRHLENEGWREYMVAWRKDRLELYRDHVTPGKEWLLGTKHLAYIAPLSSSTTHLSLYSFLDMTFCVSCPPTPLKGSSKRSRIFGTSRGTHIFVFKHKSRTRAVDWIWQLWRHLGGHLPPYIEIRTAALDTRIKVDVPGFDTGDIDAAYAVFRKDNIIKLCEKYLHAVPEYRALMDSEESKGARFELAWRHNTMLDWVWKEDDVRGRKRRWDVLCGLALRQAGEPAHLEFYRKRHQASRLRMKDQTRLDEPPAIEGYVDRIRPNSQVKQSLYLVTHDGYLFSLAPPRAHQPAPPGAPVDPHTANPSVISVNSFKRTADTRHKAEVRRGRMQILEATGVSDLRNIVLVRRAFQLLAQPREQVDLSKASDWDDSSEFWEAVDRSESDDEDAGGEGAFATSRDRIRLRMRRSFELVLTTGRVVRYETYSCAAALEWIVRLRPLVSYWRKRHQEDARLAMDIAHVSTGRDRITPQMPRENHDHAGQHDLPAEPPAERDAALPDLAFFYNWCALEGCHPVLRAGRLYGRKGLYGQYKHIQLVLISGHLVQFHITGRSSLHHRKDRVLHLLDAYVCSGYFAAQYLPEGQYDANAPPVARRYQDGLETDDGEEDTLFVLWYRKPAGAAPGMRRNSGDADVPSLGVKRKIAVFRTRSKLERDTWVWAINVEIEKVVRASREREEALRQAGQLLRT